MGRAKSGGDELDMKKLLVASVALLLMAGMATANQFSPAGNWETSAGDSRFRVTLCGDGTELCAKLTWLRDDLRTEENLAYLNKYVVHRAKPSGPDTWEGTVDVYGEKATGSIKAVSDDRLRLTGCRAVLCQTLTFIRI